MRARVKAMCNSSTKPNRAPNPSQYQYASGKNPRDFKTCTPSGSFESGVNYYMKKFTDISTLLKEKYIIMDKAHSENYLSPTVPKKFVSYYCILRIHQRRTPITPYPPFFDVLCNINRKNEDSG